MTKGLLGGIAAAGLMNMLIGPHYYSGGLFGAGPMFGGYGFGEGYEEGHGEGLEGDFGGGISEISPSDVFLRIRTRRPGHHSRR